MELVQVGQFILLLGITVSIVLVCIQLARLLSSFTKTVDEFQPVIKNVAEISSGLVEDQKIIKNTLESASEIVGKVKITVSDFTNKIAKPIAAIATLIGGIGSFAEQITGKINSIKKK